MSKKAFLIYQDSYSLIEKLSNEQIGIIFRSIFDYENKNINPNFKEQLLDLVFNHFKIYLDNNREKWFETSEKRAIAGSKGGIANASKCKQMQASDSKEKQIKQSVAVIGNVIVNDIDIVNNKEKYGVYKRILLTKSEYEKLKTEFSDIDKYINLLDEYIQSNDNKNKYKDFNLVIRKSIRDSWSIYSSIKNDVPNEKKSRFETRILPDGRKSIMINGRWSG